MNKQYVLRLCRVVLKALCLSLLVLMAGFVLLEGEFRNWVVRNFLTVMDRVSTEEGGMALPAYFPRWGEIRSFIIKAVVVAVCVVVALTEAVAVRRERREKERLLKEIAAMIHTLSEAEDVSLAPAFPADYAEIENRLVQMKAAMQRQKQLLKEEAAQKNDLITGLAHDLKTPLTSVIGYLSLLDEADDMPRPQRTKYTKVALDKAYRLESLINEFFDITRYNLQTVTLQKEKIDLNYMLLQMAEEFYPLLTPEHKRIELHVPEHTVLYGDAQKLARVFNNVLKNAVSYSRPDSVIDVFAENTEDRTVLIFRNEGKRIPKEKLEFLFKKFYRLDEARATHTGGAGLGLAIAREIAALHGGTIHADSNDQYTLFVVELPVNPDKETKP